MNDAAVIGSRCRRRLPNRREQITETELAKPLPLPLFAPQPERVDPGEQPNTDGAQP